MSLGSEVMVKNIKLLQASAAGDARVTVN